MSNGDVLMIDMPVTEEQLERLGDLAQGGIVPPTSHTIEVGRNKAKVRSIPPGAAFWSIRDVEDAFGLTYTQVYYVINNNYIPSIRIGNVFRIPVNVLHFYAKDNFSFLNKPLGYVAFKPLVEVNQDVIDGVYDLSVAEFERAVNSGLIWTLQATEPVVVSLYSLEVYINALRDSAPKDGADLVSELSIEGA
jgi:hypothetical protein